MMKRRSWCVFAGLCALVLATVWAAVPASAQMSEAKEKTPMYSYVSFWNIPRAQWAEMAKEEASDRQILDKAIADGTLVGYGHDVNLVHQADQDTHDEWWSATSMAGVLKVLEQFYKSGGTSSPVLASSTKHWDAIYVSRYYNWHSGAWKGAYTHGSYYKLKAGAPEAALEMLSRHLFVPFFEKLLADGTIYEYEVDTEAIHTEAPGAFWIFYVAPNGEALDKVNAALEQTLKASPLSIPAFDSLVDFSAHRDYLLRSNLTYK
jgi:hypothetical protein